MNLRILLVFSVFLSINVYAQIDTNLIYRDFKLSEYNREDKQADTIRNVYNSLPLVEKMILIEQMIKYNEGKEGKCQYQFLLDGFPIGLINCLQLRELYETNHIKTITFIHSSSEWCSPGAVVFSTE